MPIQTCSKPAVSSVVGLVILATITPATQSFRHIRASLEELVLIEGMGHDLPQGAWPTIIDAIVDNAARAVA